jgi:hypothetical protein
VSDDFHLRPAGPSGWLCSALDRWHSANRLEVDDLLKDFKARGFFAATGIEVDDVRRALIDAVVLAAGLADGAKKVQSGILEAKDSNDQRARFLNKLRAVVEDIESEASSDANASSKWGLEIDHNLDTLAVRGRLFLDALDQFVTDRRRAAKGDKTNHLANEFARQIRTLWSDATGLAPPADGGKDLRRLAVSLWTDLDMPRDKASKDENLDRWMARRFSETAF